MKRRSTHGTTSSGIYNCEECGRKTVNSDVATMSLIKEMMDMVPMVTRRQEQQKQNAVPFVDDYLSAPVKLSKHEVIDATAVPDKVPENTLETFSLHMLTDIGVRPAETTSTSAFAAAAAAAAAAAQDSSNGCGKLVKKLLHGATVSTDAEEDDNDDGVAGGGIARGVSHATFLPHTGGRINEQLDRIGQVYDMSMLQRCKLPFHFIRDII